MNIYLLQERIQKIPERIRWVLKERHIDKNEAASALKIDPHHYSRILRGKRNITMDVLALHCEYLQVSISFLLVGDESLGMIERYETPEEELEMLLERLLIIVVRLPEKEKIKACKTILHRVCETLDEDDLAL